MQYSIFLALEKYSDGLSLNKIAEIIGGCDILTVISECNALLFHPSFNPKKIKTNGLISSDKEDNSELNENDILKLNRDFQANSVKINTIPTIYKVINLFN